MCEQLRKKSKRSFSEAWLNDDKYASWIRKVSNDDSLFHCIMCNKDFSCNTRISSHANAACHKENVKKSTILNAINNNDVSSNTIKRRKNAFRQQWLDIEQFKPWLREVSHDENSFFCSFCNKTMVGDLSHIYDHSESKAHKRISEKSNTETKKTNETNMTNDESLLTFEEQKKLAEIRFAALIADKNISHQTATDILSFFQQIGKDYNILKSMTMGRTKCQNIISNVLCSIETNRVVNIIQNTRFSIFIDETFDICNEKWMTFLVRYVDPEKLDIRSQLIKLINIDAKNSSAEKLFDAFKSEMYSLNIPFLNIIALSCDNASVMIGKNLSFKTKLAKVCKNLLTFPCPCHSAALIAHAACTKIPEYCEEFLKKIASYINSSPKRLAIFQEFIEYFQETKRKILRLADTRWLSHHTCVERLLESWGAIKHFLIERVVDEKTISGEHLLTLMQKLDIKAYFLFLKYILYFLNLFNAFFQAVETRIHLLQSKTVEFLTTICKHFLKPEYLKNICNNIQFSDKNNQKSLNEINLGSECEEYLDELTKNGHVDLVANVRENCLQFYVTAAEEISKRLPINDKFLTKLKVFNSDVVLFDFDRETTFNDVSFIAQTLGGFDEDALKKEWLIVHLDFTIEEKINLKKLNFDDMWKEILQSKNCRNTDKYPNLKSFMNAVRSLPNSNADPERMFSILSDLKTKKRNCLSSVSVNATCVLKSALKARKETVLQMEINEKHLSLMSTNNLYTHCLKKQKCLLNLYSVGDIAGPSTSNTQ